MTIIGKRSGAAGGRAGRDRARRYSGPSRRSRRRGKFRGRGDPPASLHASSLGVGSRDRGGSASSRRPQTPPLLPPHPAGPAPGGARHRRYPQRAPPHPRPAAPRPARGPRGLPWEEGAAAEDAAAALLPVAADAKEKLEDEDDDEAGALPSLHGTPARPVARSPRGSSCGLRALLFRVPGGRRFPATINRRDAAGHRDGARGLERRQAGRPGLRAGRPLPALAAPLARPFPRFPGLLPVPGGARPARALGGVGAGRTLGPDFLAGESLKKISKKPVCPLYVSSRYLNMSSSFWSTYKWTFFFLSKP